MSGVIPPIFASSIMLFPATLIQWIEYSSNLKLLDLLKYIFTPGKPIYIFIFAVLIIFFSFFYTTLVFNAKDISENLRKSGGFIPGIRPGDKTTGNLEFLVKKLTFIGSIYLTIVCIIPELLILFFNIPFYFGGTSLLIVVVVIMDFIAQIQNRMISYKYQNILKKYTLKK
jgi:preprotein translocase subunit SecY